MSKKITVICDVCGKEFDDSKVDSRKYYIYKKKSAPFSGQIQPHTNV